MARCVAIALTSWDKLPLPSQDCIKTNHSWCSLPLGILAVCTYQHMYCLCWSTQNCAFPPLLLQLSLCFFVPGSVAQWQDKRKFGLLQGDRTRSGYRVCVVNLFAPSEFSIPVLPQHMKICSIAVTNFSTITVLLQLIILLSERKVQEKNGAFCLPDGN